MSVTDLMSIINQCFANHEPACVYPPAGSNLMTDYIDNLSHGAAFPTPNQWQWRRMGAMVSQITSYSTQANN